MSTAETPLRLTAIVARCQTASHKKCTIQQIHDKLIESPHQIINITLLAIIAFLFIVHYSQNLRLNTFLMMTCMCNQPSVVCSLNRH